MGPVAFKNTSVQVAISLSELDIRSLESELASVNFVVFVVYPVVSIFVVEVCGDFFGRGLGGGRAVRLAGGFPKL